MIKKILINALQNILKLKVTSSDHFLCLLTVQNPKKSNKSTSKRSWNQEIFNILAWKMTKKEDYDLIMLIIF